MYNKMDDYTLYETLMKNLPSQGRSREARMLGQTSQTPYGMIYDTISEDCKSPISKQEFLQYIRNLTVGTKFSVMVYNYDEDYDGAISYIFDHNNMGDYILIMKFITNITDYSSITEFYKTESSYQYDSDFLDKISKVALRRGLNSEIIYDVITLYNILTNRGSCISFVKDYAKNYVLLYFNTKVQQFSTYEQLLVVLNIYLYCNAVILGISSDYQMLNPGKLNTRTKILKHVNKTKKLRLELTDTIREFIVNL